MRKVVFIMAAGHSGSTLLDLIIGSHSSGFSLGELWSIPQQIDDSTEETPAICGICAEKCTFWNQEERLAFLHEYYRGVIGKSQLRAKITLRFDGFRGNLYKRLFEWSKASILVDSGKNAWWIRRQLRAFWHWKGITPYLLFLTRDGRAVANSRLRKYPETGMAAVAKDWKKTVSRMENLFQAYPPERRMKVSYEALTTRQRSVIEAVCDWLDIPFDAEMLNYWKHDHHLVAGNLGTRMAILKYRADDRLEYWSDQNRATGQFDERYYNRQGMAIKLDLRWKRELNEAQLKIFDSVAGEFNQAYAYDPDGAKTLRQTGETKSVLAR